MDAATTPRSSADHIVNAMTVDVEDYFQVSAFERVVARERWDGFESRVCRNTERLLAHFEAAHVLATFFVLGWVAERFPALVRQIAAAGHELASHGYAHRLVYQLTPREFADDLHHAKAAIEAAGGMPVLGYRAPSFSITKRSLWAFDQLIAEGFVYDASVYPIHHDRYGIADSPRHPYTVERPGGSIRELPGSTVRIGGQNLPIGGGGYFRIFPYEWIRRGIARVNDVEGQAVTFYIHPWEIDPDQPRIAGPLVARLRHYLNLGRTESRLDCLLHDFRFGRIDMVAS